MKKDMRRVECRLLKDVVADSHSLFSYNEANKQ
jgi:hypothetical protein